MMARSPVLRDLRDDSSDRTGQRLVVILKRDAQPRVVLNQPFKYANCRTTSVPTCSRLLTAFRHSASTTHTNWIGHPA